jgi:class 3 adenylate cyclase
VTARTAKPQAVLLAALEPLGARSQAGKLSVKASALVAGIARSHGGVVASDDGKAAQIVFAGAEEAVVCAVALLRRVAEHNKACDGAELKLRLRQALCRGHFELKANGAAGQAADTAAGLLSVTPPGRILASRAAYSSAIGRVSCEFVPLGTEYLPGHRGPVDVFEVVPLPDGGPRGR